MAYRSATRLSLALLRQRYCCLSSLAGCSFISRHASSVAQGVRNVQESPVKPAPGQLQYASYGLAAREIVPEYDTYKICIQTGNVRGAGTKAGAYIQLVGTDGQSDKFIAGDSLDVGFTRGSKVVFDVAVPKYIGSLRRLLVEKVKASASDTGDGWFLEQVEVLGPQGTSWTFPCHAWLGNSDCGNVDGPLDRNLIPSVAAEAFAAAEKVRATPAGVAFPHPQKAKRHPGVNRKHFGYAGEDAYFYCYGRNDLFGMGVSDGVYMWREKNIDSGAMARCLMETAQRMIQAGYEDILKVLQVANRHVESEGVLGSCTASMLVVNQNQGRLHAANLGDSGFLLLGKRRGQDAMHIQYRSAQLEHEFGCPYQLGHHQYSSRPEDAQLVTLPVRQGDVLVMGTDGLLDNLSDMDILSEVRLLRGQGASPSAMVQHLAKLAFENSIDQKKTTPYSLAATEAFDMVYSGGKPDDISVLVACLD